MVVMETEEGNPTPHSTSIHCRHQHPMPVIRCLETIPASVSRASSPASVETRVCARQIKVILQQQLKM